MNQKTIRKLLGVLLTLAMIVGLMPGMGLTAHAASTTVTWNNDDITGSYGRSFSKDGVTITAGYIDFMDKNFKEGGTFTTTLGNFTKIEVSARGLYRSLGTGWSMSSGKATWTGNATSVAFSDEIMGRGRGVTFVFTIETPSVDVTSISLDPATASMTVGGETLTLTPTVLPADATDKTVTWTTSAPNVATVADGVVTAVATGTATITATANDGSGVKGTCTVTVTAPAAESTYTLTIPSALTVENSGWNATSGISATGTLARGKKLTVTAASANSWALKSGGNSVGYKLATASTDTEATTSWTFDSLSSTATKKDMGIIVEDYSSKPAGTYQDTVTFTASVEVAKSAAEKPDIAQADCTFSPSNGKSTLSNANITTAMEYSADNGTTWTDVTSAGSIASLAAGTVQIRVKETDEKLASEAVSITVPEVLHINELVGPYTGDKLTCEYYAGETWQALVDRYDLIKVYSGRAAFGSDGFIYYKDRGNAVPVTDLVDNTRTYEVQ